MKYIYDHVGVPVKRKRRGMVYYPEYKVWCSKYEKDRHRIEWIYFEKGSPMHRLIRSKTHVCFVVSDIKKAVRGKKILLKPTLYQDYYMAFIEVDGLPIEFFQRLSV